MWEIDNRTEFSVGKNWVRDEAGLHHWIVAVKGTFQASRAGGLELAEEQPAPTLAPEYLGEPGVSSLRCDTDLGLMKPGTDVIVIGHAHAPQGRPVAEVTVGLRISQTNKTLLIRGENSFSNGLTGLKTTTPIPFVTMPIVYERAFGGVDRSSADPAKWRMDLRNPLGLGFGCHGPRLAHTTGPNVLHPSKEWSRPAGFGAICSHWSPRLELSGTYDEKWKKERFPLLPRDFDRRCLMCSPEDQRFEDYLTGGETIEVVNMSERGSFTGMLPTVKLSMTTMFGFKRVKHAARLTTILVEPERELVACVWQSSLAVPATQHDQLDVTKIERV